MNNQSSIKTIKGIINELSSGITSVPGAVSRTGEKQHATVVYDYIDIDGKRWGNITVTGSIASKLSDTVGQDVTLHYVELEVNKSTRRMIIGVEYENGTMESILVDDIVTPLRGLKTLRSSFTGLSVMLFGIVGGIISTLIGIKTSPFLGWPIFVAGLIGTVYLVRKHYKMRITTVSDAFDFAKEHNKVI